MAVTDPAPPSPHEHANALEPLLQRYRRVRQLSLDLCAPLEEEDYRIQSMPDVSPPWWNLGHTSWFFAKNILEKETRYAFPSAGLEYVLNSYYEAHGERVPRHERGMQSRPTTREILDFRAEVDQHMLRLMASASPDQSERLAFLVTAGIEHEQQHQELLVTEIKHILGSNAPALRSPYHERPDATTSAPGPLTFTTFAGGVAEIGANPSPERWSWDNEAPRHRVFLEPFEVANRLVTAGEFAEFIEDGGYEQPLLWMANGWAAVQAAGWTAPLFWERHGQELLQWTLHGLVPVQVDEPVAHVSFYEADAYANWRSSRDSGSGRARLPTEAEWEHACTAHGHHQPGAFLDDGTLHPRVAPPSDVPCQLLGNLWEWTSSHYEPYPGYHPFEGDLMEYNGKFMDNQRVLRGGSCATPEEHIRASYRNFWPADTRFQFSGIRLARSV